MSSSTTVAAAAAAAATSSSAPSSEPSPSPRNTSSPPGGRDRKQQQGQKMQQGKSRPQQTKSQSNNRGSGSGTNATDSSSGSKGRHGSDSSTVQLSKALSWLLRHNAESQGIAIRPDGFCLLSDVMAHSRFTKFTVADVMGVVETNDKKRFEVMEEPVTDKDTKDGAVVTKTFIRAVQGHSIKAVEDLGLEPLTDPAQVPTVVHGTLYSKWDLIRQHGLSRMNRNHIHMAAGLLGESGVISGMRKSCNLYVYIDTAKAIQDGIKFFRTSNSVILSDGLNGDGTIPAQYFLKVVKSSGEQVYPTSLASFVA